MSTAATRLLLAPIVFAACSTGSESLDDAGLRPDVAVLGDAGAGLDRGFADAGLSEDGGAPDVGSGLDAGLLDAGLLDAGLLDAGLLDADLPGSDGSVDAGPISSCGIDQDGDGDRLDPGEECDDGTPTSALFDGCEQCRIVPVTLAASDAYHLGLDVFEDGSIAAAWGGLSGGLNGATFRAPNLARSGSYLQGVGADLRTLDVLALDQGRTVLMFDADSGFATPQSNTYFVLYSASGAVLAQHSPSRALQPVHAIHHSLRAARSGTGFVTVWWGHSPSGVDIWARYYDGEGVPSGAPLQVTTSTTQVEYSPDVRTLSDGRVLVVWESGVWNANQQFTQGPIEGRIIAATGPTSPVMRLIAAPSTGPRLAALPQGFAIAVSRSDAVVSELARFDLSGALVHSSTLAGGVPAVESSADGALSMVYSSTSGRCALRIYDPAGALSARGQMTGPYGCESGLEVVRLPNGDSVLLSHDPFERAHLQRFSPSGAPLYR